jgi:hypothetical protein
MAFDFLIFQGHYLVETDSPKVGIGTQGIFMIN